MRILILIALFFMVIFSLRNVFDPNLYVPSRLEADRTFTRQEYLGEGLGKIYKNRFGVVYFNKIYPSLMKFESNFFSGLDDGLIFMPLFGFLLYLGFKKFS